MSLRRTVLVVDAELDAVEAAFQDIFVPDRWRLICTSQEAEAKELIRDNPDIDIIIVGYDLGEENSLRFLEFVRGIDDNVAIFFMDDDPHDTFSAYDCHRFRALSLFIHKPELLADPQRIGHELRDRYDAHVANLCSPRMQNEHGKLRAVLVHEPSAEIDRIDPDHLGYYLFESLPSHRLMQEQHRGFRAKIKEIGYRPLVIDIRQLLFEVICEADEVQRRTIIENCLYSHELRRINSRFVRQNLAFSPLLESKISEFCKLDPLSLADMMFSGVNIADFLGPESHAGMYTRLQCQVIEPVPNIYFMRDPGFVLGDTFFFSRMYRKIRQRETNILREIIERHPHMHRVKNRSFDLDEKTQDAVSIEGGDTMCVAPGHFAVAESERTSRAAIRRVAEYLFKNKKAEKLFQPLIPPKRAYIHLDTVCSLVGPDSAIVHSEAFNAYSETLLWTPQVIERGGEPISLGMNFIDVLKYEFGKELIQAGGGGTRARLEQFDDATNVFMVNPESPMVYDRNDETNKILVDHGFKIGSFAGSDLVMGRGGARCMTLPLHRD